MCQQQWKRNEKKKKMDCLIIFCMCHIYTIRLGQFPFYQRKKNKTWNSVRFLICLKKEEPQRRCAIIFSKPRMSWIIRTRSFCINNGCGKIKCNYRMHSNRSIRNQKFCASTRKHTSIVTYILKFRSPEFRSECIHNTRGLYK